MKPVSWRYIVVILMLAVTLAISRASEQRKAEYLAQPLERIDLRIGLWTGVPDPALADDVLQVLKPTEYISRTYRQNDKRLGLFVAYYAEQRAGESMHSPKNCLPGNGWEVWDYGTAIVPVERRQVRVNRYSVHNGAERVLVLYWYQSRDRIVASEYLGKIYLVRDALFDGRTSGSIVRILLPDQPGALDDAVAFASLVIPQMQGCFSGCRP